MSKNTPDDPAPALSGTGPPGSEAVTPSNSRPPQNPDAIAQTPFAYPQSIYQLKNGKNYFQLLAACRRRRKSLTENWEGCCGEGFDGQSSLYLWVRRSISGAGGDVRDN